MTSFPTDPAAPVANGDGPAPGVTIQFPPFSLAQLRAQGPRIRAPGDPSMDMALVRDVNHVAKYAQQCAYMGATQVGDVVLGIAKGYTDANVQALLKAVDQAVEHAINAYDQWRRRQVWYRRIPREAWLWITAKEPTAKPTQQPPAEGR